LAQGKLIEIHFSAMGKICGAKLETCKYDLSIYIIVCHIV